ncbi:hypothetical protein AYI68_g7347 [Smittium mucronatum]|uniref:Uncharacterized protein n=1 Tax=Smittium mucronatum TaxID=133383 RepID=A0A1R0GNZ5_9FUNG|nr:hypothetical protein AYI68_g7347 [Smittium mucronatum]
MVLKLTQTNELRWFNSSYVSETVTPKNNIDWSKGVNVITVKINNNETPVIQSPIINRILDPDYTTTLMSGIYSNPNIRTLSKF